jgi:hypothetical protein
VTFTAAPRFAVDPLLIDASFQVAANWLFEIRRLQLRRIEPVWHGA